MSFANAKRNNLPQLQNLNLSCKCTFVLVMNPVILKKYVTAKYFFPKETLIKSLSYILVKMTQNDWFISSHKTVIKLLSCQVIPDLTQHWQVLLLIPMEPSHASTLMINKSHKLWISWIANMFFPLTIFSPATVLKMRPSVGLFSCVSRWTNTLQHPAMITWKVKACLSIFIQALTGYFHFFSRRLADKER